MLLMGKVTMSEMHVSLNTFHTLTYELHKKRKKLLSSFVCRCKWFSHDDDSVDISLSPSPSLELLASVAQETLNNSQLALDFFALEISRKRQKNGKNI